jgi:hypothetical protein
MTLHHLLLSVSQKEGNDALKYKFFGFHLSLLFLLSLIYLEKITRWQDDSTIRTSVSESEGE